MQMAAKQAKYGKPYNTPIGLQEDSYYEMMYDLMDYIKEKGLTTRQAQCLFTDCADMVLDVKNHSNSNIDNSAMSDMDRLIYKLDQIKVRLEDIPEYKHTYIEDNVM